MPNNDDIVINRIKKNNPNKKNSSTSKNKKKEVTTQTKVISILIMVMAVFLLLSMLSHSHIDKRYLSMGFSSFLDMAFGSVGEPVLIHNWLGIVGAWLSNFFFNSTFGYTSIGIPFFMVIFAKFMFQGESIEEKWIKHTSVYLILGLLFSAFFGTLQNTSLFVDMSHEWYGFIGEFLSSISISIVGIVGSILLYIAGIVVTVLLGTDIKLDKLISLTLSKSESMIDTGKNIFKSNLNNSKPKNSSDKEDVKINDTEEDTEDTGNPNNADIPNETIESNTKTKERSLVVNRYEEKENQEETPTPRKPETSKTKQQAKENIINNDSEEPARLIRTTINSSVREPKPYETTQEETPQTIEYSFPTKESEQEAEPQDTQAKPKLKVSATDILKNIQTGNKTDQTKDDNFDFKYDKDYEQEPETNSDNIEDSVTPTQNDAEILPHTESNNEDNYAEETINQTNPQENIEQPKNPSLTVTVHEYDDEEDNKPVRKNETVAPKNVLSTYIHDEKINYAPPTINIVKYGDSTNKVNEQELKDNARILQEKLETFKIFIENLSVTPGPVVTQYEFVPAAGIKISKIEGLADDLAMALKARGIRVIAPIPGKGTVGIEIPNQEPQLVRFGDVIKSEKFKNNTMQLPLALGKQISGEVYIVDLAKMPHLLIAGSTGAGKSVGINTLICSLLYKKMPNELKFVIVDPKKVELQQYSHLKDHFMAVSPDLNSTIVTDPKEAVVALKSAVVEMEKRYDILAAAGDRNIKDYNRKVKEGRHKNKANMEHRALPYIVVVIDELADLMLTAGKEVEEPITRLAQMARAVGIHLVIATQRPSVDVITGLIKANFPARMAYLVATKIDSRTILDFAGAEKLLGNGDMLCLPPGTIKPIRVQNSFIDTDEVDDICEYIGNQRGYSEPYYLPSLNEEIGESQSIDAADRDPLFEDAARLIIRHQQGSVSLVQRRLKVGYARAGRIVDELEAAGIVGPFTGSKARDVLLESESELEAIL